MKREPQPVTPAMAELIWWGMLGGVVLVPAGLLLALPPPARPAPAWGDLLFAAGIAASLPAWIYSRKLRERGPLAPAEPTLPPQLMQQFFLGWGLAELPLYIGVAHLVLTGNRLGIGILTGVSIGLMALYRPSTVLRR